MSILRKTLVTAAVFAAMVAAVGTTDPRSALADGGPHGGYTATGATVGGGLPDQCGACHRVHQGKSTGKLLKATSPYALCLTCHNGTGSVLDVWDGVKLGALETYDASVVRAADTTLLNISAAPSAAMNVPPGGVVEYTIAVRNRLESGNPVTLAIVSDSNAIDFTASTLSAASGTVPAAAGNVPGVLYFTLTATAGGAAPNNASNLTTVRVTDVDTAATADIVVQTKVGTTSTPVLNGGGFMFVNGTAVTSRHNADPADNMLAPWGFNNMNTGQRDGDNTASSQLSSALQCTSCHNPHGTTNYRILKETINAETVNVKVFYDTNADGLSEDGIANNTAQFVRQEGARGLEAGAPADKYTVDYYGSSADKALGGKGDPGVASLCGACHTAYPSSGASLGNTANGVTHYRHATEMPFSAWSNPDTGATSDNPETAPVTGFPALRLASNATQANTVVTCLTCHRVHGTNTTMQGYALKTSLGGTADEDLSPAQAPSYDTGSTSTLLFTNNRGMCQACHQWGWNQATDTWR